MFEYRAQVAYTYDGDSIRLDVDLGFSAHLHRVAFRLARIDTPELGQPGGIEARDWLRNAAPIGAEVIALTYRDKTEKYGRYLVDLYLPDEIESLNQQMLDLGLGVPYDGGAR